MPSTTQKYFAFAHLPPKLQAVSKPMGLLAEQLETLLPDGPEKSAGMRQSRELRRRDRPPDRARQRRGEDLAVDGVRTAYQAGNLTSFNGMTKAPMWRLLFFVAKARVAGGAGFTHPSAIRSRLRVRLAY